MPELSTLQLVQKAGYRDLDDYNNAARDEASPQGIAKRREELAEHAARTAEHVEQVAKRANAGKSDGALAAEGELESLAKRHSEHTGVTEAAAYDAVLKTEVGAALYKRSLAKSGAPGDLAPGDSPQTAAAAQLAHLIKTFEIRFSISPEEASTRVLGTDEGARLAALAGVSADAAPVAKAKSIAARVERITKLHRERGESDGQVLQRLHKLGHPAAVEIVRDLLG